MVKLKIEKGEYLFKLEDVLKKKNISINKLMRERQRKNIVLMAL